MNTEPLLEFASDVRTTEKYRLVKQTLEEIDGKWHPYPLEEMKRLFPLGWQKIIRLEGDINRAALEDNIEGLKGALEEYKNLVLSLTGGGGKPPAQGHN